MKKLLLAAIAAVAMGSTAMALDLQQSGLVVGQKPAHQLGLTEKPSAHASRATEGYLIDFVGDIYTWTGMGYAGDYKVYQYIPADIADCLAGNELTTIYFSAIIQSATTLPGTIFVAEDIDGAPVTSTEVNVINCYTTHGTDGSYYQIETLDEPYVIKEGQGFYYGFTVEGCTADDYPLGVDYQDATDFAGGFDFYYTAYGQTYRFDAVEDLGTNLAFKALTVGDKTSVENVFAMTPAGVLDGFALPMLSESSAEAWVYVANYGDNQITSLSYEYSVNGGDKAIETISTQIPGQAYGYMGIPVYDLEAGRNTIDLTITEINGISVANSGQYYAYYFGDGVATLGNRKMIVEEGTGTWCGWCPRGIVGMEYMEETYPDSFVGIAVHASDSFEAASYEPIIYEFFSGFPSCVINREPLYIDDPSKSELEAMHAVFCSQKTPARVEILGNGEVENKTISVRMRTKFVFDETNANYKVAFVVLEDGLTARQTNKYAGYSAEDYPEAGDWVNMASSVRWTYTNTARDIFDAYGMEGYIPSTVVAGEDYTCEYTVDLSNVKKTANTSIVAMLIDGDTGVILDADKMTCDELSGINDAVLSQQGAAVVRGLKGEIAIEGSYQKAQAYTLSGQAVSLKGLTPGLYIVNVDGQSHKVIVK
ncbi:MAG: Omp28-related outer membrane protein [Bacteroidales bacterium]|nr:Omp28-related outer membrane protein [Bacteroidales bacterium]